MVDVFYLVIGVLIGVAAALPFTYKAFVNAVKTRRIRIKVDRLYYFINSAPKCHKNHADDIREHIKHNMDELDDILDDLRTVPQGAPFWGKIRETIHDMEGVQKEFRWRPSGSASGV